MEGSLIEKIEKIRKEHKEKEELEYQEYLKLNPITDDYINELIDKTFVMILERCATEHCVTIDFSKECEKRPGKPSKNVMDKYMDQMLDTYIKRLNEREPKLRVTTSVILNYRARFISF